MSAIRVEDAAKRYFDGSSRVLAVDGVSLEVPKGSLSVLLGPSGSGKTTLLGMMGGLITPTRGEVEVMGKSVVHMRDHHRTRWRRRHVGFVFQDLALVARMTLLENVLLPLAPLGGARKEDAQRADALLERFGLKEKRDVATERLSGGERQRGALARASILEPTILLLDEPTAHVDADNAERILGHLCTLRDEGRAVVASTHDPRLADDPRVDRVFRLDRGKRAGGEEE